MRRFLEHIVFFYGYAGWRLGLLVVFTFGTGILETIGLAMFLPLLELGFSGSIGDNKITNLFAEAFALVGLPVTFHMMLAMIVCVLAAKGAMGFCFRLASATIQLDVQERLRLHILESSQTTSYRHWLGQNLGAINNILVREVDRSTKNLNACVVLVQTSIMITIFVTTMIWVDPIVGLVSIVFGFCVFGLFRRFNVNSRSLSHETTAQSGTIQRLALQLLQSFKYLKSTAAFRPLQQHVEDLISARRHLMVRMQMYSALIKSSAEPLAVLVVAGFIIVMIDIAAVSLTTAILPILLLYRSLSQVQNLNGAWNSFMQTTGSVQVYRTTVDAFADNAETTQGTSAQRLETHIKLTDVTVKFHDKNLPALDNISLEIPAGQIVGIVGETGAGKTTLVDVITGLLSPDSGQITWNAQPYSELDLNTLRARIGYVTQEPVVFDDTIGNNITSWGPYRNATGDLLPEIVAASEAAQCLEVIEATEDGFETILGERGVRLSGGQRQRIAIARELYRKPDLLVFDEGTSSLDIETERALVATLENLARTRTVIIVAHRFATIRVCDQVFVLNRGRIVECGSWEDLAADHETWFGRAARMQGVQ